MKGSKQDLVRCLVECLLSCLDNLVTYFNVSYRMISHC